MGGDLYICDKEKRIEIIWKEMEDKAAANPNDQKRGWFRGKNHAIRKQTGEDLPDEEGPG